MGFTNGKLVKKSHTRKIKTKSGSKVIRVKAATVGSVATNKLKRKKK